MADPYTTGRYAEANPDWHQADAPYKARALARTIRYCGLHPHTVVDVGCGTGAVLRHLKHQLDDRLPGTVWEGWDIAPEAIRRARQHEGSRLLYVCEDFLRSERRVDLLLCIDTFEHVPDDEAFLRALRDRAAWHLFRIPLDLSGATVLRPGRLLDRVQRYGHRHLYTRELALDLLRRCGYGIESERYDRIPPPLTSPRRLIGDLGRRLLYSAAPHRTVRWLGGWSLIVCCRGQGTTS